MNILLSNSQAGPGRTVKQQQEEISRNHVQAFILGSVQGSAKEWFPGCMKRALEARGGQDAENTQPRDHSAADPCIFGSQYLHFNRLTYARQTTRYCRKSKVLQCFWFLHS